jgi:hypothetical protein
MLTQLYCCVMAMPDFNSSGNLPPGLHCVVWDEFAERFGATPYRKKLLRGLRRAMDALKQAGCKAVYIDGSFVTIKEMPADFDGCWDTDGVNLALLDPVLMDLRPGRWAQKTKYGGELFPAQFKEAGSGKTFLDFFSIDKGSGDAKGIVVISLQGERA